MKINKILLVGLVIWLASTSVFASEMCWVRNEMDQKDKVATADDGVKMYNYYSLRGKVDLFNSGNACQIPAGSIDTGASYQRGIYFITKEWDEMVNEGGSPYYEKHVAKIELKKPIQFTNKNHTLVIGMWSPNTTPKSNKNAGQVVISADNANFEPGMSPFTCGTGAKNVTLRNIKLITENVTKAQLLDANKCLKDGGDFIVESGDIEQLCDDGKSNDKDNKIDCDDSDCSAEPNCVGVTPDDDDDDDNSGGTSENCAVVGDEDKDGKDDCSDLDCKNASNCEMYWDHDIDGYCEDDTKCFGFTLGGTAIKTGDCDDDEAAINPGVSESTEALCIDDFIDNDCDGKIDSEDEGCDVTVVDADMDGFCKLDAASCPEGKQAGDCNDNDNSIRPNAAQLCADGVNSPDNDCNPETVCDDDGTISAEVNCSDNIDDEADGDTDCDDSDCAEAAICDPMNIDNDNDGVSESNGDCNDEDPAIFTGNTEVCGDAKDNNCSGTPDEGCAGDAKEDDDGDGFCEDAVSCNSSTVKPGDCRDDNAAVNPEAVEICDDNIDNDCDGSAVDSGDTNPSGLAKFQTGPSCSDTLLPKGDAGSGGGGCNLQSGSSASFSLFALMSLLLIPAFIRKQKV